MPANYDRPYPETCSVCGLENPPGEHFKWNPHKKANFGGVWRCREEVNRLGRGYAKRRRADPVRNAKNEAYTLEYYERHPNYQRYKAYRSIDNRRFGGGTLAWTDAEILMESPCTYCKVDVSNGLDRRNNSKGHSSGNVVPCCFVCNTILGDIPEEAKDLLAPGLQEAREKGYLDSWIPPQKRK